MNRLLLAFAAAAFAFCVLASPASAGWTWPLRGEVITPYSNGDDPYASGQHRGIDIAGETGEPVVAAMSGTVRFAGTAGASGLTLSIRTLDGFDTSYLHLSSASVREGQSVAAGERIGAVGTSGTRSAEPPHLHFGVREAGSRHAYRDPLGLLPAAPAAPEGPRETPVPQPAPAPLPPALISAPSPVRVSDAERTSAQRRHARAGGRGRAAERVLAPDRSTAGQRAPAGRPLPTHAGVPAAGSVPHATEPRLPRHAGLPHPARGSEHRSHPSQKALTETGRAPVLPSRGEAQPPAVARLTPPESGPAQAQPRGPDVGLVLACLGLLGAAALLGLSEDGRAATRRTRQRAAGLLRPLLSRRQEL